MQRVFIFHGAYRERIRLVERLEELHSRSCYTWAELDVNGTSRPRRTVTLPFVVSLLEAVYHPDLYGTVGALHLLRVLQAGAWISLPMALLNLPEGPPDWDSLLLQLGPSLWPALLVLVQNDLLSALEQLLVDSAETDDAFSADAGEQLVELYFRRDGADKSEASRRYDEHTRASMSAITQRLLSIRFLTGPMLASPARWQEWERCFPVLPWEVLNTMDLTTAMAAPE